ncbi:hypothetical protein H4V99_002409 [Cryobacterium sp. CG_9.6]|nr:hypothetical protein [Cryobacterium sp. CG_9.6]
MYFAGVSRPRNLVSRSAHQVSTTRKLALNQRAPLVEEPACTSPASRDPVSRL